MKSKLVISATLIALGLVFAQTSGATAAEGSLDTQVSEAVAAQISSQDDANFLVSNVKVDVSQEVIDAVGSDPEAIAAYLIGEATTPQTHLLQGEGPSLQPMAAPYFNYVADQTTLIPAFGVAWVNQKVMVTKSGGKISTVKKYGVSYGTGISLFAYSQNAPSTIQYNLQKTCWYTKMYGTFSAIVKGSSVAFDATVKATDGISGGKLQDMGGKC